MRIVVTGGSGKGGSWVVRDLREHGHEVVNVDNRSVPGEERGALVTDLTDPGQTQDALAGADAVVHFAAIPAPGLRPDTETFRINMMSTYNVFAAAVAHGMKRVVWASSETVLGLPFDIPPAFAPIDETIEPRPESSYSLSKLAGETLATQFARRSGIPFLGMRISNIMEPADYARFPSWQDDATIRKWNLWGYVDARDVAQAARLGLEAPIEGARGRHRGRRGHRDDPPQRRPDGRGLPHGPVAPRARGPRDAALDRARPDGSWDTHRRTAGRIRFQGDADPNRPPPDPHQPARPGGLAVQPGPEPRSRLRSVRGRGAVRVAADRRPERSVARSRSSRRRPASRAIAGFGAAGPTPPTDVLSAEGFRELSPTSSSTPSGRTPTSTASTSACTARWSPTARSTPRATSSSRRGRSSGRTSRSSSRSTSTAS